MVNSIEQFKKHVRAAEGIYRRLDSGRLTGRNSVATKGTLSKHVRAAEATLTWACKQEGDPLPEFLDNNKLWAEKWNRLERRWHGLPVGMPSWHGEAA